MLPHEKKPPFDADKGDGWHAFKTKCLFIGR